MCIYTPTPKGLSKACGVFSASSAPPMPQCHTSNWLQGRPGGGGQNTPPPFLRLKKTVLETASHPTSLFNRF